MIRVTLETEVSDVGCPLLGEGRASCNFFPDPIRIAILVKVHSGFRVAFPHLTFLKLGM